MCCRSFVILVVEGLLLTAEIAALPLHLARVLHRKIDCGLCECTDGEANYSMRCLCNSNPFALSVQIT